MDESPRVDRAQAITSLETTNATRKKGIPSVAAAECNSEIDEDDGSDFYLKRLLEERKRLTLSREEAEWIESYIIRQHLYKQKHGVSIDTMGPTLRQALAGRTSSSGIRQQHGRNVDCSAILSGLPMEHLVSVMSVIAFIALTLAIQAFVVFGSHQDNAHF